MANFSDYFGEEDYLTERLISRDRRDLIQFSNHATDRCYVSSNEFLSNYMSKIKLKNKRVATVGSSGDQVLNALYYGSKDVTLIDANPYTRAYVEYKMALIKCYDLETFSSILDSSTIFNWKIYNRISHLLSKPVQQFWDTLILEQNSIYETGFGMNVYFDDISLYEEFLQERFFTYSEFFAEGEKQYNKLKNILLKGDFKLKFVTADISEFAEKLDGKYDVILLSNIYNYVRKSEDRRKAFHKTVKDLCNNNLKPKGVIQVNYRYGTNFEEENLKQDFKLRKEDLRGLHSVYFIDKAEQKEDEETTFGL